MYSKFENTYKPTNPGRSMIPKCIKKKTLPEEAAWTNFLDDVKGKHFENIHGKNAVWGENTGESES